MNNTDTKIKVNNFLAQVPGSLATPLGCSVNISICRVTVAVNQGLKLCHLLSQIIILLLSLPKLFGEFNLAVNIQKIVLLYDLQ